MIPSRHEAAQTEHGKGGDMPAETDRLNTECAILEKKHSFLGTVRNEFGKLSG